MTAPHEPPFPIVDKALIDWLDFAYPEKSPELTDSLDKIRFDSGARSVVHKLRQLYADQNDTDKAAPETHVYRQDT